MRGVADGAPAVVVGLALIAGCSSESSPLSDETWDRLRAEGGSFDLVYTVELPGYEPAEQSVGVIGDGEVGSVYLSAAGAQVELRVDRGGFSDEACSTTPLSNLSEPPADEPPTTAVSCEPDDTGWYRVAGHRHEYVIVRHHPVLRLAGPATRSTAPSSRQPQPTRANSTHPTHPRRHRTTGDHQAGRPPQHRRRSAGQRRRPRRLNGE